VAQFALDLTHMNKALGIALLVAGVILIVYGINGSNSISSNISQTFTGSPTNKTLWLLVGGAVSAIVGLVLALTGFKNAPRK
jgi:drug/metabolite transporter (DMT)-like permease